MTEKQFTKLVEAHRLRGQKTIKACRLVLLKGFTAYAASKHVGLDQATLSRALHKLKRPLCPHCGQPMKLD
jgi:hypothetical protein